MLDKDEKVAVKIVEAKSNPKQHMITRSQCQVERHMNKDEEEKYELINLCTRREPIP